LLGKNRRRVEPSIAVIFFCKVFELLVLGARAPAKREATLDDEDDLAIERSKRGSGFAVDGVQGDVQ